MDKKNTELESQKSGKSTAISKGTSIIASFWQRLGAIIIDSIVLGIIGQVLGWTFSSSLFNIGPYGRFIGLVILLAYFGLLNSKIGNGQTIGKRLFKIAVRGESGNPIDLSISLFRALITTLPGLLNGWQLPAFGNKVFLSVIQSVLVLGIGPALAYTMVFNRVPRQGLHDMICKTYVVRLGMDYKLSFPKTKNIHWIISSAFIFIGILIPSLVFFQGSIINVESIFGIEVSPVKNLYEVYSVDNRFFSVNVTEKQYYSNQRSPARVLVIEAWHKGRVSRDQTTELIISLVDTAMNEHEGIKNVDYITVSITSAYDIGIARGYFRHSQSNTVNEWEDLLASDL